MPTRITDESLFDAQVDEKVMGYPVWEPSPLNPDYFKTQMLEIAGKEKAYEYRSGPPPYSTNILEAWKVVTKLTNKSCRVQITESFPYRSFDENLSLCRITYFPDDEGNEPVDVEERNDEAPLAICKAALRMIAIITLFKSLKEAIDESRT
jgi:hypothetical protein